MLNHIEALAEDVVHVYVLWVAGVCHTMVADEHNIKDICEIASHNGFVEVPRESVHLLEDGLEAN